MTPVLSAWIRHRLLALQLAGLAGLLSLMVSAWAQVPSATPVTTPVTTPAAAGSAASAAASTAVPVRVPIATFFEPIALRAAQLSPNGRWLAITNQPPGARARLVIMDTTDQVPSRVVAQFSRIDVRNVWWVNDQWLVFDTTDPVDQSAQASQRGPGLLAVNRAGQQLRLIIKREWDSDFSAQGGAPLDGNHRFLQLGDPARNQVIVGRFEVDARGDLRQVVPLAVDVSNSAKQTIPVELPGDVRQHVFDHLGRVHAALTSAQGVNTLHWRDPATQQWRALTSSKPFEAAFTARHVDELGQLHVAHADRRGFSLWSLLDPKTGRPDAQRQLVSLPGHSSGFTPYVDRSSGRLLWLRTAIVTDGATTVWLEQALADLQEQVDALLPGRINTLSCGDCAPIETGLVRSESARFPGEYLLYKPATGQWTRLGARQPTVKAEQMADLGLHQVKARDGLTLPVWVTNAPPPGAPPRPAVVLVHGGPWSRGVQWAWHAEAQFLASRGYVVIEPEFRGSLGYGTQHFRAGWRQWGQAMQDDLSDALAFAAQQGWADPKRACIAGASYGGYAALMGLAKRPDEFRCGVAWVAVSDPALLFDVFWSDVSAEVKAHGYTALIGDPVKDAELLAAHSPLKLADRITAPVLLAYGGRDRRVPLVHGQQMRDALTQAGHPPEWVLYEHEGHGFQRSETLIDFWGRVEAFLARHLKN